MTIQEKAAGVLPTPTTASKELSSCSLSREALACKAYSTLRAEFALLGVTLRRCHRASDGRITYQATRNGQSRVFTHLHDLHAYLAALEEAHQQATAVKLKSITFEGPFDDHESD